MTLFIRRDAGTAGSGSVFPDRAAAHLLEISNMDTGYGEVDAPNNLIRVTYARTQVGPAPERLDELVNTDFPATVTDVDIIIIATDSGFTLADGTVVDVGATAGPHTHLNGVDINPSESVVVFYDTTQNNGDGVCPRREGGGYDLRTRNAIILYHELSHALHFCNNTRADDSNGSGCTSSTEEHNAIVDENLFRDQLGEAHRDPNDHCTQSCGGGNGGCCIVATVASGSPYSREVNELRTIRDTFLRRSEIGYDFFERLHGDYYRFSPEVCRMMARDEDLRRFIGAYFVRPLAGMLKLIHRYTTGAATAAELGAAFVAYAAASPELQHVNAAPEPRTELAALLEERAITSDFVRWALIDVLMMFVRALELHASGAAADQIGETLAESIDDWCIGLPLTPIWTSLSRYTLGEELDFLAHALLRDAHARTLFAGRLLDRFGTESNIARVLSERGWLS